MCGVEIDPVTSGAIVDDTFMTSVPGVFACGNVLHVHDLVDWVSVEATQAGAFAAGYAAGSAPEARIPVTPGDGVRYTLPQRVSGARDCTISLRVGAPWRDRSVVVRTPESASQERRAIKRTKMVRLHPAEMIRVDLKAEDIAGVAGLEVCVE